MLVQTNAGMIERDLLTIRDVVTEEENARIVATEWFYGDELVRRDVNVNILNGQILTGEQFNMGQ